MIAPLLRDVRLGLRSLARSPGYAATTVVVLGLAIGAATAVFTVVDAFLLHPLPWKDPDRLIMVVERQPALPEMSVSYPDYADWRERSRSWSALGGFQRVALDVGGEGGATPEHVTTYRFSAQGLPALGVEPALGRNFTAEEDRPNAAPVALLGWELWQARGGDPAIVGKTIRVEGKAHTVVGVLPRGFRFYRGEVPVVTPLGQLPKPQADERGAHPGIFALGRLAPGVTLEQARAEMDEIGLALQRENPEQNVGTLPLLARAEEKLVRDVRKALLLLLGAVGFVVAVAIANVSSLTLARGLARRKELAIRAALGAGRGALVRQVLAESVVVALLGGAAGVLVAAWGVDLLSAFRPASLSALVEIRTSTSVLLFAVALSLVAGALCGLLPAISLSEPALHDVLKTGDLGASAASGGRRARAALVVVEVALAFVLLAGATMSARALQRLQSTDPGFDARNVLVVSISLPSDAYATPERIQSFRTAARERLSTLPGIESAALTDTLPLAVGTSQSFDIAGRPPLTGTEMPFAAVFMETPGFLETMRIPVVAGRSIEARDDARVPEVTVIDEVLARKFFPDQDPIGQRITSTGGEQAWEIIGVARHVAGFGLAGAEPSPYQLHAALAQAPAEYGPVLRQMHAVVRTAGPPLAAAAQVRAALSEVEPGAALFDVRTMEDVVARSLAAERFSAALLSAFGLFSLVLAGVGLFGLVSHGVVRRTREIGVRMALGATPEAVQRMVVADGLRHVAIGLGVGAAGALALGRVLGHLFAGAGKVDVPIALAAGGVLGAVALLASWLPARRAVRVDPSVALRAE